MLLECHANQLVTSAIDIDLAKNCGVTSIINNCDASKVLGYPPNNSESSYLLFNNYDLEDRNHIVGVSLRPDHPSNHSTRYIERKDQETRLYVPRIIFYEKLNDVNTPLFVTEGQKKALSGISNGLLTIGICGVTKWRTSDWERITLKDRMVFLIFDSDVQESATVFHAEKELSEFLTNKKAEVYCVRLPRC